MKDLEGTLLHAGKPWKDKNSPDMDSLASAPHMVDFDADGDLDLLVGNIAGRIILIENVGTAKAPKFAKKRVVIRGGDAEIRVPGGDSGPTTADWDGDGLWDLLVGAGDGSVWFFKNTGAKGKPVFAAAKVLIAKSARGYQPLDVREEPKDQGSRSKVCVVDYDMDGHLDLLVGDFVSVKEPAPVLDEARTKARDALRAERDKVQTQMQAIYTKHKDDPKKAQEASRELSKKFSDIYGKLRKLEGGTTPTGYVWFFKRKAPVSDARTG